MNLKVGANFASRIYGLCKQTQNGVSVAKGTILDSAYTSIRKGNKHISRMIPKGESNITCLGDRTKITTVANSRVGGKPVTTVNNELYTYGTNNTLDVVKEQRDILPGRGSRVQEFDHAGRLTRKLFYDAEGNLLKDVSYKNGVRRAAFTPDRKELYFDEKGLPVFTDMKTGGKMDLGGLDRLI